jgi:hypothetical protein
MLRYTLIALGSVIVIGIAFLSYSYFRKKAPAEKLEALRKQVKKDAGVVFETDLGGKHLAFLLLDCKVYLLDASGDGDKVARTQVLKPGMYLWFTACLEKKIWVEDGYLRVYLLNRALGAGGGNASGGDYRSKDGMKWEKQSGGGWYPVEDVQN